MRLNMFCVRRRTIFRNAGIALFNKMKVLGHFIALLLVASSSLAVSEAPIPELIEAAGRGDHEKVKALLAAGASVGVLSEHGETPLHVAASRAKFLNHPCDIPLLTPLNKPTMPTHILSQQLY